MIFLYGNKTFYLVSLYMLQFFDMGSVLENYVCYDLVELGSFWVHLLFRSFLWNCDCSTLSMSIINVCCLGQ